MLIQAGVTIHDARTRRGWTLAGLAQRAGVSVASAHAAENGVPVSLDTLLRLATPLGLKPQLSFTDGRAQRPPRDADPIHAAMAELEARHFRAAGFTIAVDESYQHYQFAGRADLVAWDLERRALLHCENRTLFPNVREIAGAWNAKRAYLASALAERLDLRGGWLSATHAMVALWSSEVLHVLRLRTETFRAVCPDTPDAFAAWWSGTPPARGTNSTFVLLDPLAHGRQRQWVALDAAVSARPRLSTYREAAVLCAARVWHSDPPLASC